MNNLTQEQIARIYDMYPESVRLRYTGDNNRDHEYNGLTLPNWRALRDSRAKNPDWKLLLRPLSAITDEQAIEVIRIFHAAQLTLSVGIAVPLFIAPGHPDNGKDAIALGLAIDSTI